jgi:hypothetical protein
MSKIKERSFGGAVINSISPNVQIGKGIARIESSMYNINLSYDGWLRLVQAGQNVTSYLSKFKEQTKEHKQGVNLVVNFETGRVEAVAVDKKQLDLL